MNEPVRVDRYISLITEEELERSEVAAWFRHVTNKAPYGVVTTLQGTNNEKQPQTITLVHRETKSAHSYMIPITRDLLEYEAQRIVTAWAETHEDVDFDIEVTVVPTNPFVKKDESITVEQQKYVDLASSWAKKEHEEWASARTKEGWRYGQELSIEDRTHPLLRPWSELSDKHKSVDFDRPQKLIDLLNDQGYAVVSKDDIMAVQRLLRKL